MRRRRATSRARFRRRRPTCRWSTASASDPTASAEGAGAGSANKRSAGSYQFSRLQPSPWAISAAAGNEEAVPEALVGLAVLERLALQGQQRAAGRLQDRVARGDVPFHGRAVARIDVGRTLGDAAELDGRIHRLAQV